MTRSLPLAFRNTVEGEHFDWFWLVEMQLASGTVRLCGLDFDVDWGGFTWTGARGLGSVDTIEEAPGEITGLSLSLAGVTEAHIAEVLLEPIQGRTVIVRLAVLDKSTNPPTVVVDGNVWQGLLDVQRYIEGSATVTVTAENRLIEWDRPRLIRFSDEDQRRTYPADGFFKHLPQMVERTITIFSKEALARRV
jgi:hypothetical protein